jgi:hypothetical protein
VSAQKLHHDLRPNYYFMRKTLLIRKLIRGEWICVSTACRRPACLSTFLISALLLIGTFASAEKGGGQSNSQSAGSNQTYEGMITDTRCGAKHSAVIGLSASDCARACVHAGEHFVLVDGDSVYILEGESASLKQLAGQRVRIMGLLKGNKISVSSVAAENK